MYGYQCAYCKGTVQPRVIEREAFKHKHGFVILEHIVIGVCDTCGNRYYTADILHTVHNIDNVHLSGLRRFLWPSSPDPE